MDLQWLRPQRSLWDILEMEKLLAEASDSESESDEDSDSEEWISGMVEAPKDTSFELAEAVRALPFRRRRMLVFELLKVNNAKKNAKIEELKSEAYRRQM